MLFEGSEKKLEIVTDSSAGDLRQLGRAFWSQLVESAGAQILSVIEKSDGIAYLLSESSLFVWENKITMITCGRTTLTFALKNFLKKIPIEQVEALVYERKNEYDPRAQRTDFMSDIDQLKLIAPGFAYRFGHAGEHHIYLYHLDRPFKPSRSDVTAELLMYHIGEPAKSLFSTGHEDSRAIRDYLKFETNFPGYQWGDHVFNPCGYSINGLKGRRYVTMHVTPQDQGSYVSFETNADLGESLAQVLKHMLDLFRPQSFDLMSFRPDDKKVEFEAPEYRTVTRIFEKLKCGYRVHYTSHYLADLEIQSAHQIEV